MAGSIREKQKMVREQGYKAAKQNKIFPRELQNAGDLWEDAQLYDRKTRQGQNNRQAHMRDHAKAYEEAFGKKRK